MNKPKIEPARRVGTVKEYYFSRKLAEVAAMKAAGHDIISLAIGGPDMPPSPEVIDTLCTEARRPDVHSYQNTRSIPQLRNAYADFYNRHYGVTIDPETEILPLIGSKEGVMHLSMTFLNAGDKVLIPDPGYPTYTSATLLAEGRPLPYTLLEEDGYQPDFDELERLAEANNDIRLMWVNYPNMPTGAPARRSTFERLVEFGRRHSIIIVHDNPYSFILNDHPMSIMQVEGAKEICIELNSLSKSHNMAGWRMAMLTSNKDFVSWILRVKSNVDSGQFRPMMDAAVTALQLPESWYESLNAAYRERRAVAEKIMSRMDCVFDSGQTGLFLWGKVPERYDNAEQLTEQLLHEAGVFVTPGFIFGRQGHRYLRISLCATVAQLEDALRRIDKFMQKQNK